MTGTAFTQQLSPQLFWDVERASVDPRKHRAFLIPRIMDRGTREDVKAAREFYSVGVLKQVLVEAPSLHPKTIAYFATLFELPRDAFRAYRSVSGFPS